MRWFYYYPTWNRPSGGNKQLRLAMSLLRQLGVETILLRDRAYAASGPPFDDNIFYGAPVTLAPFVFEEAGTHLQPEDVLLLPEVVLEKTLPLCQGWRCRLALNNQNGFYGLRYSAPRRMIARSIEFAVANAPYVAALCRDYLGIDERRIFLVPHWVVRSSFDLRAAEGPRNLAVCYMPRKLPDEGRAVRESVRQTHTDVPWVEIDGLPEPRVAQILRENSIFFAAQDLEGCPLPALEAMSCGCLVAGFAGTAAFPHPYATPANGFWAPDRNVSCASDAVRSAIEIVRAGGTRYEQYLNAGRRTVGRFTEEVVKQALADMVSVVGERRYAARRPWIKGLGLKGNLFACKLLYDYDRLGWPGRVLSEVSEMTKPLRRALAAVRS